MFILQDNKLYISSGKNKIVGVEIYSDKIVKVKGSETTLGQHRKLTAWEVKAKFNISEDNPYKFPLEKKDVSKDEPTPTAKKTTGKSK